MDGISSLIYSGSIWKYLLGKLSEYKISDRIEVRRSIASPHFLHMRMTGRLSMKYSERTVDKQKRCDIIMISNKFKLNYISGKENI